MQKKNWFAEAWLLVAIIGLLAVSAVVAQEAEPDLNTLEEITGTDEFYNQTVTLEGFVNGLVNSSTLIIGENAALDDDRVLVVDNTSQPFDLDISEGTRVRITGVVLPSLDVFSEDAALVTIDIDRPEDGMMDEEMDADTEMGESEDADAEMGESEDSDAEMGESEDSDTEMGESEDSDTEMGETDGDMDMAEEDEMMNTGPSQSALRFIYNGNLVDRYNNFTIIVIESIEVLQGPDQR